MPWTRDHMRISYIYTRTSYQGKMPSFVEPNANLPGLKNQKPPHALFAKRGYTSSTSRTAKSCFTIYRHLHVSAVDAIPVLGWDSECKQSVRKAKCAYLSHDEC